MGGVVLSVWLQNLSVGGLQVLPTWRLDADQRSIAARGRGSARTAVGVLEGIRSRFGHRDGVGEREDRAEYGIVRDGSGSSLQVR